jgi:hypothetical protein
MSVIPFWVTDTRRQDDRRKWQCLEAREPSAAQAE